MTHDRSLDEFEQHIKDTATTWTTFYLMGPYTRVRTEHTTEAEAIVAAQAAALAVGKAVMVYAVNPAGRSTLAYVAKP